MPARDARSGGARHRQTQPAVRDPPIATPGDTHPPAACVGDAAACNATQRRIARGNPVAASASASTAHSAENRMFGADPDTTRNRRQGERTSFKQAL